MTREVPAQRIVFIYRCLAWDAEIAVMCLPYMRYSGDTVPTNRKGSPFHVDELLNSMIDVPAVP